MTGAIDVLGRMLDFKTVYSVRADGLKTYSEYMAEIKEVTDNLTGSNIITSFFNLGQNFRGRNGANYNALCYQGFAILRQKAYIMQFSVATGLCERFIVGASGATYENISEDVVPSNTSILLRCLMVK